MIETEPWILTVDFEVQRCTRRCATTDRQLQPGEDFFSTLQVEGAEVVRRDYSTEAWQGPPEGVLGWWKSQMPSPNSRRIHWAPNDVMLELFEELADQPERRDMRYVLALLLMRRRVVRLEETEQDEDGGELLVVYCPRRETTYKIHTTMPTAARTQEIQEELAKLLFADAA